MSLSVKKVSGGGHVPVFQTVLENAQGGFSLVKTGLSGTVLKGTPVFYNEADRKCTPFKCAVLQANAADDATVYRVIKGHHLIIGDQLAAVVAGQNRAITAIDTTHADYDAVTLAATLAVALTAGTVLFKSSGTAGNNTGALHVTPNGLLYEDCPVDDNEPVSVVIRGTAYKRRIPNGVHAETAKALNLIKFSDSL
jgi:hypothetical protein